MMPAEPQRPGQVFGRYVLFDEIAAGGMATVHLGRLLGPVGFSRTIAIKRLHSNLAKDPEFLSMFLDEARLAARIHHPNVVATLDVVSLENEVLLVMDYVEGESLSGLLRGQSASSRPVPLRIASAIMAGVLNGLHAAHEATSEQGTPLGLVHRDVSPQNVIVGVDGVPRVLDFGVAKASHRVQNTRDGQLKGKFAYMAPEQVLGREVDRRTDVFSASIVLWEMLTGQRMFDSSEPARCINQIVNAPIVPPSQLVPLLAPAVDAVVLRGLARDADQRFQNAREMAIALERAVSPATARVVGEWVGRSAGDTLQRRAARIAEIESISSVRSVIPPPVSADEQSGQQSASQEATAAGVAVPSATAAEPAAEEPAPEVAPRSSRGRRWIVAAAVLVVAAAAFVGLRDLRHRDAASGRPVASGAAVPAAVPAVGSETTATATAVPPKASASAGSAVSAASETPAPQGSAAAPSRKSVRRRTRWRRSQQRPAAKRIAAPHARPDCNPPYTLDAEGQKHFKVQCL